MVVMDARVIKQNARGLLNVVTPKLQRALADFAAMRPDVAAPDVAPAFQAALARAPHAPSAASAPLTLVEEQPCSANTPPPIPIATKPAASPAPPAKAAAHDSLLRPASAQVSVPGPARAVTPSAFGGNRTPPTVTPEIDRLHAALRRSPIALHVQRLVPLIKGGQLKRYEVLLRSKSDAAPNAAPQAMLKAAVENGLGSMIDRRVITELIGYLVRHPDIWKATAVQFSVNLTATALHDEHFIKFVELCLVKSSLPKGMIAFEIDTLTAVKLADKMAEVAAALLRLGCPLVLDDFDLKTECFALLRLPGLRYVKLAPEITTKMRTDKLSQAAITAVVQMARVLGMHTVAKRTETAAEQEWLTALGVDFVQSNSMSPPVAIDTLSKTSNPLQTQAPSPPV